MWGWREVITALHEEGLTTPEIAEVTGYTPRTVRQYLYRLGLKSHRYYPRRSGWEERLREAHGRGLTTRELMAELGWSIDLTRKRLSMLRLPANKEKK